MKKILLIIILIFLTSQLHAQEHLTDLDRKTLNSASYQLKDDPVTSITLLQSVPDCDDKYALMHKATVEIAKRSREDFYYGNKVNPQGRGKQIPNAFEKYITENPKQFNSASEGAYEITANNYWIEKIKDPDHPVLADFAFQNMKLFYDGAWEEGDGSMHNDDLIERLKDWIKQHPDHANVPEAFKLIESMRNNYFGDARRREIPPDLEMLTGTWNGVIQKEDDNGKLLWTSIVTLKISTGNLKEGKFTIRETGETWRCPVSIKNDKIVMTILYEPKQFIMERAGQEYLISIKYKDKFRGHPSNNTMVFSK